MLVLLLLCLAAAPHPPPPPPSDPARWAVSSASRVLPVKPDGTYEAGPVRPGEYLIAALAGDAVPPNPADPEILERVARGAQRITLVGDDRQVVDLRVRALRYNP